MSNVERRPQQTDAGAACAEGPVLEPLPAREVPLGGTRDTLVRRSLPHRDRRTVGAWCFVDHYGPTVVGPAWRMDVPPHPHTGLQTVSWLLSGRVRHLDMLGSDVVVAPGQLNLMTSGEGVAHAELSTTDGDVLHGVQLWVALPEHARHQAPHFEQHTELPQVEQDGASVTVVLGSYRSHTSPAATYTAIVGLDVDAPAGTSTRLALEPEHEHAVLLMSGEADVEGEPLDVGSLLYLGRARTGVALRAAADSRLLVIGGEPFEERMVMWWNFVGRTHEDVATARADWQARSPRFGEVSGYDGEPLPAPELPGVPLKPRSRLRRPVGGS